MAQSKKASSVSSHPNSFKSRRTLKVGNKSYVYYSLKAAEKTVSTAFPLCPIR